MKNLPKINPAKAVKASLPYLIAGLLCTKLGEAYRLTTGGDVIDRLLAAFTKLGLVFQNPFPSLHPFDLLVTAAAVLAAGTGVYALLVLPESVIPYEESGVSVSSVSLGDLGGKYLYCSIGTSEAAGSVCHDPVTVQTEEGEKTVVILYAYSTPWSKYVETNLENGREDSVILEPLGSADEIDEVYYGEFEPVSEFYEDPDSVLEKAELIWSAESR